MKKDDYFFGMYKDSSRELLVIIDFDLDGNGI